MPPWVLQTYLGIKEADGACVGGHQKGSVCALAAFLVSGKWPCKLGWAAYGSTSDNLALFLSASRDCAYREWQTRTEIHGASEFPDLACHFWSHDLAQTVLDSLSLHACRGKSTSQRVCPELPATKEKASSQFSGPRVLPFSGISWYCFSHREHLLSWIPSSDPLGPIPEALDSLASD